MTQQQELKVTERDQTLTPRKLRVAGYIPATLYGKNIQSVQIQVKSHEFAQLMAHGNRQLKLSGYVNATAQVRQLQVQPVSQRPISAEFYLLDGAAPQA
jgi:ribosomal protein L25 (general stress protein Ctc)